MKYLLKLAFLVFFTNLGNAQIINGLDTLYGNEWINFDQSYFKILVAEDGIYRVSQQVLSDANLPLSQINGSQFQLFHNGVEVPIYITTDGLLGSSDYFEFYGKKNTSELDRYLFKDPDAEMMNPMYSLFTDTAAYFLTWNINNANQRFENITNDLSNLPPKNEYCWYKELKLFSNFHDKKRDTEGVRNSYFETAEGFASNYALSQVVNLNAVQPFNGNVDAKLNIRYSCAIGEHNQLISINGLQESEENFNGFSVKQVGLDLNNSALVSQVKISFQGIAGTNDKQRIGYVEMLYPRLFDFGNAKVFDFELEASANRQYLEITNFNVIGGTPVIYDLTNNIRIETILEGNHIKVSIPPLLNRSKFVIVNPNNGIKQINLLNTVQFINYYNTQADYIILSNPKLYSDSNGVNWVQEYANYRSSAAGGSFSPIIVDVQQLYEQFGWGINRHSLAVSNFAHFVRKVWNAPKFFFIIGSAREYPSIRTFSQLNVTNVKPILVPTFGIPGSDNLLIASKETFFPIIPIGRIAVTNTEQIKIYLNKVKEFEQNKNFPQNIENRQWMKNVIHLGGGGNIGEQSQIKSNLEAIANILESGDMGAKVEAFYKTSTDPIQQSQSQRISELINDGVSIVNFFGHSGTEGFDFSVDNPATYQNKNKYPLIVSMGCYSGQIHDNIYSIGEQFIFEEDKGAIAFLATTGLGYSSALNEVVQNFYNKLGGIHYGQSLGKVLRATYSDFQNSGFATKILLQQFTYHGDPALILNAFEGPDFIIDPTSPSISPIRVNAQDQFFAFKLNILNIGRAIDDSLTIEISRQYPNNSVEVIERRKVPSPKYEQQLEITIPVNGTQSVGFNKVFIKLDPENLIVESKQPEAEINNELIGNDGLKGFRFYVFPNGITASQPEKFSIINETPVSLKAFTSDPFAIAQNYYFEIDTTEHFNSPLKQMHSIVHTGGVIEWIPNNTYLDNTVYYWRVSPDSLQGQGFNWSTNSFLVKINSKLGWNQSHFFQFQKDNFNNTELKENTRRLKYLDDIKTIKVLNGVYPNIWPSMGINNNSYVYLPWDGPITGGVYISVFDSLTVDAWINNPPGDFGSHISPWAYWAAYPYWTTTISQRETALNFLNNVIPSGNYVLVFTIQTTNNNYKPEEWAADSLTLGTNLFQFFEQQGAKKIRSTSQTGAKPYVFFFKKDDPSYAPFEKVVETDESIIQSFYVNGNWYKGFVETPLIGPSARWDSLSWHLDGIQPGEDSISLQVYGVKSDSMRVLLYDNQINPSLDISSVNSQDFPFLKLRYNTLDSINRTPPQLDYWRVYYEGLPDAAIDPSTNYVLNSDTLQEGQLLHFEMAVKNLGRYDMDSLLVRFLAIDNQNQVIEKLKRVQPLPKSSTITADFQLDTKGLSGNYELWIEVNANLDQPELTHANNVAISHFYVERDKRNPIVDVTFDGTHILNGDLVSARPNIVINLEDENPFLPLNDTSLFKLFLQYPDSTTLVPISIDGQVLIFTPASSQSSKNKARLEFYPHFVKDGEYILIVQAKDVSNNSSGQFDFKVSFKVITKSMISNVLNYPNPFSNSTRFVYTLTGEEPPGQFKIQILTIAGKIVREIKQDEIGQLRIGTHQTDFAWDGRDEFGDQLANGVYLYRILAKKSNGEDFELMSIEGADKFFSKGFGKMVIIR